MRERRGRMGKAINCNMSSIIDPVVIPRSGVTLEEPIYCI